MLNNDEIINIRKSQIDGDMWEYTIKDIHGDYKPWTKCTITDEINPNAEYRKVEKWYVYESGNTYESRIYKTEPLPKSCEKYSHLFMGTKEECEKWIEEHTKKTWLEEYLKQNLFKTNSIAYEETRYGITNVCKKILEEMKSNYVDKVTVSIFENIIKDLGVEL